LSSIQPVKAHPTPEGELSPSGLPCGKKCGNPEGGIAPEYIVFVKAAGQMPSLLSKLFFTEMTMVRYATNCPIYL